MKRPDILHHIPNETYKFKVIIIKYACIKVNTGSLHRQQLR